MDDLKKAFDSIEETFDRGFETMDRGFERQEAQAKRHFEELIAKIDEITLETTKRIEEKRRFDELVS